MFKNIYAGALESSSPVFSAAFSRKSPAGSVVEGSDSAEPISLGFSCADSNSSLLF